MKTFFAAAFVAVVLISSQAALAADSSNTIPETCKVGDFVVGCQAYTFKNFTAFEAVEKTAQAGGKVIEFFPGQKFSKEKPDQKWDHNASDDAIKEMTAHLEKNKIRAVNYGVVGGKDETEWRKIFEFAKKLGLYAITTEAVNDLDTVEKLVKEYDIRIAIHEHAKRPNDPNYKIWDPNYVLSLVKNRDSRIGACADTGHWASSGLTPLECIKILRGRIISLHLKERTAIGQHLPDAIYGTGVSQIKEILDELRKQKFKGNISIEYENNWDHSVPDVAQCVGFIRGYSLAR